MLGLSLGLTIGNPILNQGGPVSIEHTANAVIVTDLTTYTFSNQSLGAASAGRKIVVGVASRRASAFTFVSVTIGGVAASAIAGTELAFASGLSRIALYQADVPAGTTGDIVVTCSAETLRCGIGVWALANANTVVDTGTSITDPATDTLTVPANGAAIGYGFHSGLSAATATWTGITEDFDEVIETLHTHTGASAAIAAGGATAISCDWSVAPDAGAAFCLASFGP